MGLLEACGGGEVPPLSPMQFLHLVHEITSHKTYFVLSENAESIKDASFTVGCITEIFLQGSGVTMLNNLISI